MDFLFILMYGFGLGFISWILARFCRFLFCASSNPNHLDF